MGFFEARFNDEGKQRSGHLAVVLSERLVHVRFFFEDGGHKLLGRFPRDLWQNQREFNKTVRGLGIVWRRTLSEGQLSQRRYGKK